MSLSCSRQEFPDDGWWGAKVGSALTQFRNMIRLEFFYWLRYTPNFYPGIYPQLLSGLDLHVHLDVDHRIIVDRLQTEGTRRRRCKEDIRIIFLNRNGNSSSSNIDSIDVEVDMEVEVEEAEVRALEEEEDVADNGKKNTSTRWTQIPSNSKQMEEEEEEEEVVRAGI